MLKSLSVIGAALVLTPFVASAQKAPPIRQLGAVVATSTETFGPLIALRHTTHGVLVNDGANRRVVFLDSTLSQSKIVADSLGANGNEYSGRQASLIAFKGDSTLFVDPQSMSMVVLDGEGRSARVMAMPGGRGSAVLGSVIGAPGYDGQGGLVYRGMPNIQFRAQGGPGGGGMPAPPEIPDTMPILRVNIASRATDTLGYVKMPRPKMDISRDEATGRMNVQTTMNPLPTVDDFAVLSDGSVAMIRGRDYHVDFIRPDGTRESAGKMPFDWRRLSDEDKVAFIDSLKAARERFLAAQPQGAAQPGPTASSTTTTTAGGGQRTEMVVMGPGPGAMGGGGGGNPLAGMMNSRNVNFVPANELPDYQPPFFSGASRADMDGNVWIQTIATKALTGGPVYDVVNSKGELVDRVQIPKDRTIAGFGTGGVVYLRVQDGSKVTLERATLK